MLQRMILLSGLALIGLQAQAVSAGARQPDADSERQTGLNLVRQVALREASPDIIGVEVDPTAYQAMLTVDQVVVRDFPLPRADRVDLELTRFDVLTPNARLVSVEELGPREVPRPVMYSFQGIALGQPESVVTLNLFGGRIAGSVRTREGEFVISPASFDPERPAASDVRVWRREVDADQPDVPLCTADELEQPVMQVALGGGQTAPAAAAIDGDTMLEAEVAIDATNEWYEHFGSLTAAQNYILNVMAQVSTIYENEVKVQIVVPYLRVFTTPADPYTDTTNTSTLLAELRSEWNTNQTAIDRTTVHLFSVRPSGGSGVAYLDVLCNHEFRPGRSYDYGVSTLSARGSSWEKELVAHELGHNFSSPHTHCYVPEIDQCANDASCYEGPIVESVGTIMSYCNSADPFFHPRVEGERIRPAAEAAYPTCMTIPASEQVPEPPQNLTVE
jgi:hypothetical protein